MPVLISNSLTDETVHSTTLVVVGAGPCGLAAAVRAAEQGIEGMVLERGDIASALRRYPREMVLNSRAGFMEIAGKTPDPNPEAGVTPPAFADFLTDIAANLSWPVHTHTEVTSAQRCGNGFVLTTGRQSIHCEILILATGEFDHPKMLGIPGESGPHVSHYFDSPETCRGQKVVVVGGGHSALECAIALLNAGCSVDLVHRKPELVSVRPEILQRLDEAGQRQTLRRFMHCLSQEFTDSELIAVNQGTVEEVRLPFDQAFVMTGYGADGILQRSLGLPPEDALRDDWRVEGLTPIPGLYLIGAAGNGSRSSDRYGFRSGIPQADRAVTHAARLLRRRLCRMPENAFR